MSRPLGTHCQSDRWAVLAPAIKGIGVGGEESRQLSGPTAHVPGRINTFKLPEPCL